MIYTLRITTGREDIITEIVQNKIKHDNLDVKAILHPAELKGYIFIEGRLGDIHKAVQGLMHIKGLMEQPVKLEDIKHFIETKKITIAIGDVVEIVAGAFKGEKGKVNRVDKTKDEVTIELLEASMPIPVTIATDFVKLVKRSKEPGREEEKEEKKKETKKMSFEDLKSIFGDDKPKKAEAPEGEEAKKEEKKPEEGEESGKEAPKEEKKEAE